MGAELEARLEGSNTSTPDPIYTRFTPDLHLIYTRLAGSNVMWRPDFVTFLKH
jgi:hypothetical protein